MSCPDELTLDLWSAQALPPDEASAVAAHVASCANCRAQQARSQSDRASLHAALELDQDERAYLATLDLAAAWRTRTATDARWGWLALIGVLGAFVAWTIAGRPFGELLGMANQVGLSTVLFSSAFGALLSLIQSLIEVSTSPALSLAQPLLAVLALLVLFWPRITSAPHYVRGVRS
jgi:anti-sigma factor RsiW